MLILVKDLKALAAPIMADRGLAHPSNLGRVRSLLVESGLVHVGVNQFDFGGDSGSSG